MSGDVVGSELRRTSGELLARVCREIQRIQQSPEAGPTERVGGWTRIGTLLQVFLSRVAERLAAARGLSLEEAVRQTGQTRKRIVRLTLGDWLAVVGRLADASGGPEDTIIGSDAASGAVLKTVVELRNRAAHEVDPPTAGESSPALRSLESLLRSYRSARSWTT